MLCLTLQPPQHGSLPIPIPIGYRLQLQSCKARTQSQDPCRTMSIAGWKPSCSWCSTFGCDSMQLDMLLHRKKKIIKSLPAMVNMKDENVEEVALVCYAS